MYSGWSARSVTKKRRYGRFGCCVRLAKSEWYAYSYQLVDSGVWREAGFASSSCYVSRWCYTIVSFMWFADPDREKQSLMRNSSSGLGKLVFELAQLYCDITFGVRFCWDLRLVDGDNWDIRKESVEVEMLRCTERFWGFFLVWSGSVFIGTRVLLSLQCTLSHNREESHSPENRVEWDTDCDAGRKTMSFFAIVARGCLKM